MDDQVRRMYDVADDHEADILDALRDRAGITWTCWVRPWTNYKGTTCDDCGRTEAESSAARTSFYVEHFAP